ncbi:MAG: ABC transporter ATP-binding protein [Bacteroidetes bacterium]|nr:ABC transporter ATP-binding protein [Bacteroidota bacterium]
MTLQVQELTVSYGKGKKALDDVSFTIGPGVFGLLGPNGAGKSSLMRTIATLQRPDYGRIQFRDIDVLQSPLELRKVLGYLPQEFGVYPGMSAEALLEYCAQLKGIAEKKERAMAVRRVLELTNLSDVRKERAEGFSGGMKQRFGIAQMLLADPQLIIVDEPTAGLDPSERNRFLGLLRELGQHRTVICSTHIVEDIAGLCTTFAILDHGNILSHTTPDEALTHFRGRLWSGEVGTADVPLLGSGHRVLSSSSTSFAGRTVLRVTAAAPPDERFHPAEPTLEDVYFAAVNPDEVRN